MELVILEANLNINKYRIHINRSLSASVFSKQRWGKESAVILDRALD